MAGIISDFLSAAITNEFNKAAERRAHRDAIGQMLMNAALYYNRDDIVTAKEFEPLFKSVYGEKDYKTLTQIAPQLGPLRDLAQAADVVTQAAGIQPPPQQTTTSPPLPLSRRLPAPLKPTFTSSGNMQLTPDYAAVDKAMEAQALTEVDDLFRARLQETGDAEEAKSFALESIANKYGFLPSPQALNQALPDTQQTLDRMWMKLYQQVLDSLNLPADAPPAVKNRAAFTTAQTVTRALNGHVPDIPNIQQMLFPQLPSLSADIQQELLEMGLDPRTATPQDITRAEGAVMQRNAQQTQMETLARERGTEQAAELYHQARLKRRGEQVQVETAKRQFTQRSADVSAAYEILDALNDLLLGDELRGLPPLLQTEGGLQRFIQGLYMKGKAFWQDDDIGRRAARYMRGRKAFLAQIVRTFGERGMLTEGDIDRISGLMPTLFDTSQLAKSNFTMIRTILDGMLARVKNLSTVPRNEKVFKTTDEALDYVDKLELENLQQILKRATNKTISLDEAKKLAPPESTTKTITFDAQGNPIEE